VRFHMRIHWAEGCMRISIRGRAGVGEQWATTTTRAGRRHGSLAGGPSTAWASARGRRMKRGEGGSRSIYGLVRAISCPCSSQICYPEFLHLASSSASATPTPPLRPHSAWRALRSKCIVVAPISPPALPSGPYVAVPHAPPSADHACTS
jgi:hypothetical protein